MLPAFRTRLLLALVFLLHLLPFATRPALIGGDEPHYALMAHSIAVDGDLELRDDYEAVERGSRAAGRKRAGEAVDRHLREVNGRVVFSHPVGLPLLAAPLLWMVNALAPGSAPDIPLGLLTAAVTFVGLLAGWRILARWSGDPRLAAVAAGIAWFATPAWFYGRVFMTEGYILAFVLVAIDAIVERRWVRAAVFLALLPAMKETAVILVAFVLLGVVLLVSLRRALLLCTGPAVWGALFALKNFLTVGTPYSTFQRFEVGDPLSGAAGLMFDPVHGLSWFAPVALFAAGGWYRRLRTRDERIVAALVLGVFVAWLAVAAAWVDWRGGSSYGPRLLIPVIPILSAGLLPLLRDARRPWIRVALAAGFTGFAVNLAAALDPFTAFWGIDARELVAKNLIAIPLAAVVLIPAARLFRRHPITLRSDDRKAQSS